MTAYGRVLEYGSANTPVARREQRIRALEQLASRIADELKSERAALRRVYGYSDGAATKNVVPHGVTPATVRAWARLNGWPDLGDRGRMPASVITAYLTANPRGVTR